MVRFSDIIKVTEPFEEQELSFHAQEEEEKLWLRNAKLFQNGTEEIPAVAPDEQSPDPSVAEAVQIHEKFMKRAADVRERVFNDQGISPSPILADLHHVINNDFIDTLYEYSVITPAEEELLAHGLRVTFASLKVGAGMGYDTRGLLELGLAAFLENVGMHKVPAHILTKEGKLDKEEIAIIKQHPEISSQILSQMGKRYGWLGMVALQVHERTDGSGYPRGLKGDEILELASIVGLIDTYVAMIADRPYRERFLQTDAVKFIIKDAKILFPSKILKIFLNQISLFPVNTHVRLNNNCIGRVVSTDQKQPLRPTIKLIYDRKGNRPKGEEEVRLSDSPLLYITESIDEKDLPKKDDRF